MITKTATTTKPDPLRQIRRNCWTCPHSGVRADRCDMLTLDEDEDQPILDWLQVVGLHNDGTVPREADGCPGWGEPC